MNIELSKNWTKFLAYVALVLFISQAANLVLIAIADYTIASNLDAMDTFIQINFYVYFAMTYAIAYLFTKRNWLLALEVTLATVAIVAFIVYTRLLL